MKRKLIYHRISPLTPWGCPHVVLCGISRSFPLLSPFDRQIAHALLTSPPLTCYRHKNTFFLVCISCKQRSEKFFEFFKRQSVFVPITGPFDLHVWSTPPAFVLSQDQTLIIKQTLFASVSFNRLVFPIVFVQLWLVRSLKLLHLHIVLSLSIMLLIRNSITLSKLTLFFLYQFRLYYSIVNCSVQSALRLNMLNISQSNFFCQHFFKNI